MISKLLNKRGSIQIIAALGIFSLALMVAVTDRYFEYALTEQKTVSAVEQITYLNYYGLWNKNISHRFVQVYSQYGVKSRYKVSVRKNLLGIKTTVNIPVKNMNLNIKRSFVLQVPKGQFK